MEPFKALKLVFMGEKTPEKGRNKVKLYKYISHFKPEFICQCKKTILKIEFQELKWWLSVFAIYQAELCLNQTCFTMMLR